jgi:hypothetical protein
MSTMETSADDLSVAETNLGKALVLIQRVLPRLDEPSLAAQVQADLGRAAACVESARLAHKETLAAARPGLPGTALSPVDSVTAAIIAAAISAVLDRPHRLLSVQPVATSTPHLNVWALEGRTQIFQSHKIR